MSGIQNAYGFMRSAGAPPGSQSYTSAGTYSWVAPAGVTSVSVLVIGGGGNGGTSGCFYCCCSGNRYYYSGYGGGSGGTAWANNYTVTPGNTYTVYVAGAQGNSTFRTPCLVITCASGGYGQSQGTSGTVGGAAYNGVRGGSKVLLPSTGGYPGAGGSGAVYGLVSGCSSKGGSPYCGPIPGQAGVNGSAGGGGAQGYAGGSRGGGGGGGIGLYGRGTSGGAQNNGGCGGYGGSGGSNGSAGCFSCYGGNGGSYGGGGGGVPYNYGPKTHYGVGAGGAVRIVWPGNTRQFPSTCVGSP